MYDFKLTVAQNITNLRNASGLTQAELGEKLNYSDKSVSKWERGASLPDAFVLKQMSGIFNVSVDYLLSQHDNTDLGNIDAKKHSRRMITLLSFISVWAVSFVIYVILWISLSLHFWQIFAITLPVSLTVALVLNAVWGKSLGNFIFISALIWSILLCIYLCGLSYNWWQLFLLGIPAQIIIALAFNIKLRKIFKK